MFCMDKRKHCNVHSNWAQVISLKLFFYANIKFNKKIKTAFKIFILQNALGLIDNERMNILLQLDENNEKMRQIKQKRATRGDIISLLCNYTISERDNIMEKINHLNAPLQKEISC